MSLDFDFAIHEYRGVIVQLRDAATVPDKRSHGRQILPLEGHEGEQFVEVKLLDHGLNKGLVQIRRFDLKLVNYQSPCGACHDLTNWDVYYDLKSKDYEVLDGMSVGWSTFVEALEYLASHNDFEYNTEQVRIRMFVLRLVLCEATKFDWILGLFSNAFKSGVQVPLSRWMLTVLTYWEDLSMELLAPGQHVETDCIFYLPDADNLRHDYVRRMIGVTCEDVAKCLGVLYGVVPPIVDPMLSEPIGVNGKCLAEIFAVQVHIDGKQGCRLYGTFRLADTFKVHQLYDRKPEECESIKSKGFLSLLDTGFIVCESNITMKLDLKDRDSNFQVSGKLVWYRRDMYCPADTRLSAFVKGDNGYAIVYYTIYPFAMQAKVEMRLVMKGGISDDTPVCVCGRIGAGSSSYNFATEHYRTCYMVPLFNAPFEESLHSCNMVKPGTCIPQSKSMVTLLADFPLYIRADLKTCAGEPILCASKEWDPKRDGSSEGVIEGEAYDLHVTITWMEYKP